jgi:exopolyphosphatase/guanosine-5'-triphosphate,3'-diphosphate pyrophosphatase
MRIAVVDIGTNSTRLLVADLEDGRVTGELYRESTVTRLGAGVDADGHLHPDSIARVHATLDRYAAKIDELHADRRLAVLTSAVRDAANGAEFAQGVQERYGLEAHVIPGEEEARLTYLGANSERDPDDATPTLVVDIGGGSTELVIGHGRQVDFRVSTQAGVVRQTERHLHDDPPTPAQLEALRQDVDKIIKAGVPEPQRDQVRHAIAVAGTATSLAAIDQQLDPYDPDKVHGYVLTKDECHRLRDRIAVMTLEQRRALKGLDPARAPTIVAGVVILGEVLDLFGLDRVEVSEHDILRGAALGLT